MVVVVVCVCRVGVFLEFIVNGRYNRIGSSTREGPLNCGRVGKALMPIVTGAVPEDT